ncbi:MAG: ABC transporter permease [Vicinamibacteria bacterium]|nr:ABC transporter permease [Vicinamibacteria bacterium]
MPQTVRRIVEAFTRDVRYAARSLRKAKTFTFVAVATLGLGIGANSAVFTVVNAVLLKGLPYRDADRLMHVWETEPRQQTRQISYPDFRDVRDEARSFEGVAGYAYDGFALKTGEGSERLAAARVSANFFDVLGVQPMLGRAFRAEEDQPGLTRTVAVLSHGLWQRRFGADPTIVGQVVTLSGAPFTVIGVLPADFHFARLGEPEVFATLSPSAVMSERRFTHWMWAIGRVRDGLNAEAVNAELVSIAAARAKLDPQWHLETGLRVVPLRDALVGPIQPLVLGLFAAVAAVLLIACANVANMLLARAISRQREVGIRLAMGAGRGRIVSQFLTESVLLSLAGGALGLLWAGWGVRTMVSAIPTSQLATLPFLKGLEVEPGVLAFTFGVCLATGILFGLLPALRTSAGKVVDTLKDGARGSGGRERLRSTLVVSEIAIALALVAATGLLGRSLSRLLDVDPGFDTRNLVTARLSIPRASYDTPAKAERFFDEWQSRIASLPGVQSVALVDQLPLTGQGNTGTPSIVGVAGNSTSPDANLRTVSEDYFKVMGMPLLAGRSFTASDGPNAPAVAVVNQAFVADVLGGRDAIGQRVGFAFVDGSIEVIGVVGNEQATSLDARMRPVFYFPWRQEASNGTAIVARTTKDPRPVMAALRSESRAMEADILLLGVQTMEDIIATTPATFLRRYPLMILGVFAALALVLASIGIYGVMSLSVRERSSEIGIRMALGAQASAVLGLVLRQGLTLSVLGVTLGLAIGLAGSRVLSSALFETPPTDPAVFGLAAVILIAVAAVASWLPARRASRVDPLVALRRD